MEQIWILLPICSIVTGLVVEALKKVIYLPDDEYSKNILAGAVSVAIGILVSTGYMVLNHIPLSADKIIYAVILIIFSWLTSMLGYDKVVQTISQIRSKHEE